MNNTILTVEKVSKKFPDGTVALKEVSFKINEGEFLIIAGSNGSGKSVLMTLIAQLEKPTDGKIILNNACAGLVFQDADSQILGETVYEDVSFGARNSGLKKQQLKDCVENALSETGLLHKKNSMTRVMSGGEKRRLSLAGILAMNRSLIIFDEPFANLDYPGIKSVCEILLKLKKEKKTVILLTHEIEKCLALADRFIVLDKGQIRFDDTAENALKENLEQWSIRNPHGKLEELLWL